MLAIARRGAADSLAAGITTTADYSFSGAAATAAAELGLRAIVYLEVFAADPADARAAVRREARAASRRRELVRIGVSPHAPYTCSLDVYRWCLSLGIPVGTHLAESANENEWLEHGSGPLSAIAPLLVAADRQAGGRDARAGARARAPLRALRRGGAGGDRAARRARRAGRPLPALERAPRLRHRAARRAARRGRRASGSAPTRPASTPSFDVFEEMRPAIYVARARERRAGRAAARPTRCGWRPRTRPGRCDSTIEVGTLTPGKRADLAVVSLAGSPLPSGRGSRGGSRVRRLAGTSARDDRRRPDPLRRTRTTRSGERYATPQAPPGSRMLAPRP